MIVLNLLFAFTHFRRFFFSFGFSSKSRLGCDVLAVQSLIDIDSNDMIDHCVVATMALSRRYAKTCATYKFSIILIARARLTLCTNYNLFKFWFESRLKLFCLKRAQNARMYSGEAHFKIFKYQRQKWICLYPLGYGKCRLLGRVKVRRHNTSECV